MDSKELEELKPPIPQLTVPLASRDADVIKKLSNDDAEENLGMKVQPDGCNIRHLEALKDKVETWMSKVDVSQLPARAVWQSYPQQLWTSIKYGLGAYSESLEELENGLGTTDFYLTSRLGVVRSIPKQLRHLPHQYCGMELLNLPIETTATQVNCLLQHYVTARALGHTMMGALEHMQLKIGVKGCPLGYRFQKYCCLATNTWAKFLWEKTQAFKIDVALD